MFWIAGCHYAERVVVKLTMRMSVCSYEKVAVPVVGGHAGITILPLLSQCAPPMDFDAATIARLTERVQNGGTEVRGSSIARCLEAAMCNVCVHTVQLLVGCRGVVGAGELEVVRISGFESSHPLRGR